MAQSPEQKKSYAVIKKFLGINTKANRTAIAEEEFSWLENAMPVGYANLRVVPTYSNMGITFSHTVTALFTVNIGLSDYLIAFESDGSAEYVNLQSLSKGTLAAAGTFTLPAATASCTGGYFFYLPYGQQRNYFVAAGTVTGTFVVGMFLTGASIPANTYIIADVGGGEFLVSQYTGTINAELVNGTTQPTTVTGKLAVSQWQNTQLLIADPLKGYFTWDGTHLVNVGSLSGIGIVNGGTNYITAPTITISAPDQTGGVQATAIATITNTAGQVINIQVTSPGASFTSVPKVTLSDPPPPGIRATAGASILSNNVVSISIINPGSGYTTAPGVTISGGGGGSASATATIDTGSINGVILTNAGSGYTAAPTITISGGSGSGANLVAGALTFATGSLAVQINNGGNGYTNAANTVVTITGDGTNAVGKAIISGGQITQVIMTNPGTGYTSANVTISGGGATGGNVATAQAVVTTNQCSGLQSFSGRTWIAQGRTVFYTAAGSSTDFISVSAGSVVLNDATLHGNITWLLSANNFLYIFGDDSINVFSDVRVSSTGVTLFSNTNVSASVGSKRAYSIFPYFRSVLFANDYGIYALVGSTTTKISDPLDGIFPDVNFAGPVYGCQTLLNNILCAAFNFEYNGPLGPGNSQTYPGRYLQAIFFDKKWFFTSTTDTMSYLVSSPINGKITTYGCDGTNLYQLYSDSQSNVASYVETALLPMGDPIRTKQALKFGIEATANLASSVTITVDSEQNSSPSYAVAGSGISWVNNSGATVTWVNSSNVIVAWNQTGSSYWLYKSDAAQWGKYIGLTIQTNQPQFIVNTIEFEHELRTRF